MEFTKYVIRLSSDVPTYNTKHPKQISTYIILVGKYSGEKTQPQAGYGDNFFEQTYPLKDYTSFTRPCMIALDLAKSNNHLSISTMLYMKYSHTISKLISTVHNQHNIFSVD